MTYGCGAETCLDCYPFIYRCADCATDFKEPIPNGTEIPECPECGYKESDCG